MDQEIYSQLKSLHEEVQQILKLVKPIADMSAQQREMMPRMVRAFEEHQDSAVRKYGPILFAAASSALATWGVEQLPRLITLHP